MVFKARRFFKHETAAKSAAASVSTAAFLYSSNVVKQSSSGRYQILVKCGTVAFAQMTVEMLINPFNSQMAANEQQQDQQFDTLVENCEAFGFLNSLNAFGDAIRNDRVFWPIEANRYIKDDPEFPLLLQKLENDRQIKFYHYLPLFLKNAKIYRSYKVKIPQGQILVGSRRQFSQKEEPILVFPSNRRFSLVSAVDSRFLVPMSSPPEYGITDDGLLLPNQKYDQPTIDETGSKAIENFVVKYNPDYTGDVYVLVYNYESDVGDFVNGFFYYVGDKEKKISPAYEHEALLFKRKSHRDLLQTSSLDSSPNLRRNRDCSAAIGASPVTQGRRSPFIGRKGSLPSTSGFNSIHSS